MGSWRVGHNWATSLSLFTFMHWRRKWQPTPVFLSGESQGRGSLVDCRLWGHEESDMTERLHFHFSLSCIGEGNDNPLRCSCLENPRDGGAWWAAVYGVAQSWTRLKRLSSSSSYDIKFSLWYTLTINFTSRSDVSWVFLSYVFFFDFTLFELKHKHREINFSSCMIFTYMWLYLYMCV